MEKFRKIGRLILPLIFFTYLCNVTLFTHEHIVNGAIIVHSHIAKAGHQHTTSELNVINQLSSYLLSSLPTMPSFAPYLVLLHILFVLPCIGFVFVKKKANRLGRAPPVIAF